MYVLSCMSLDEKQKKRQRLEKQEASSFPRGKRGARRLSAAALSNDSRGSARRREPQRLFPIMPPTSLRELRINSSQHLLAATSP